MGEGLSVNKSWTIQVPNSGRTVSQNLWQYSIFPMATAPSVMYPCDGLSNMNDMQLMNFDFNTSNFLDSSTNMIYQLMPMMKQWMAQQAELYQKTMEGISGSTKIKIKTPEDDTVKKDGSIDGTKVIKETEINKTLTKMAADPTVADRMNKEITYKDKDGKDQKTTLLRRLIELSKEYQENPDNPEIIQISKENYELLWDIAGKYAKTGELSRSDYAKLVDIAKDPGGPGAYKADKGGEESKKGERPAKNQAVLDAAEAGSPDNYKAIANEYVDALYEANGTDTAKLFENNVKIDKNNVLEVYNAFAKTGKAQQYQESLVDAIFDDCDGWGNGYSDNWDVVFSKDYLIGPVYNYLRRGKFERPNASDDAKPHIENLNEKLLERAKNFAKNNKEIAKEYGWIVVDDKGNEKLNLPETLIDKTTRATTSQNFAEFVKKLTNAEKEAYDKE